MGKERALQALVIVLTAAYVCAAVYQPAHDPAELPNRIPEPPPYVTTEARFFSPPFEEYWKNVNHPGQCQSCHERIFQEWNGSMMANAWRDPVWRGAFLLSARQTSTDGECSLPAPPDGTARARHNPFADESGCSSTFDVADGRHRLARAGSLLDGFCSRCHMPSNYVDNVPLHDVAVDPRNGIEHGRLDPDFDPTSDDGTGIAFATAERQLRNTDSGKSGVFCAICHTFAATRDTPYHTLARSEHPVQPEYVPAAGSGPRSDMVPWNRQDILNVPDDRRPNLGYGVGAGSFRLSPHAVGFPERLGPLTATAPDLRDYYLQGVFRAPVPYEQVQSEKHHGYRHVLQTRAEMCSACHDVTNPLTIRNRLGRWVGGFPIERTYAEWLGSRYADRPGNAHFDPAFKRDCQTCHMQQDYGKPGTAQTLYDERKPKASLKGAVAEGSPERTYFSHHFVGGNSYIPAMVGASMGPTGAVEPYPELSVFSFTSADERSPYHNAYWTGVSKRGRPVQQARLAWDRLRNVLDLELDVAATAASGSRVPVKVRATNTGSGHKFPTGFPEGRIAWVALHAYDLATGRELSIHDARWDRESLGVGGLTRQETIDPNFPRCNWRLPAGSPDPYAVQFKAVASLGDGCPTLDLVYAHALNLVVNERGQPLDASGRVIDREFPKGPPRFRDLDGDGDVFDDSFLTDTRLDPLPAKGASVFLDRYSVVVPAGTRGPVAVSAAVYYQSVEAMVALKFLGNLADTDRDFLLEPCVLGAACDGRAAEGEPAVVEGSPPVPMEVRSRVVRIDGQAMPPPALVTYPPSGAQGLPRDVVVKALFSAPMDGVDEGRLTLTDARGARVPSTVDQIGPGVFALFPETVFLPPGAYTARLAAGACATGGPCIQAPATWRFTVAGEDAEGAGPVLDTRLPEGFPRPPQAPATPPTVRSVRLDQGSRVVVTFSEPVMNVTSATLSVQPRRPGGACSSPALDGDLTPDASGTQWTYLPRAPLEHGGSYCVSVASRVYDLDGESLSEPFTGTVSPAPAR
jgi:hypothetical protein